VLQTRYWVFLLVVFKTIPVCIRLYSADFTQTDPPVSTRTSRSGGYRNQLIMFGGGKVLVEGQPAHSLPARGSGSAVSSPGPRPLKGFLAF